jgi:hypothetical protein
MRALVEAQLSTKIQSNIVAELLDAHEEAKRNYYLGGLRLSAVEGGRFCEAAFIVLEELAGRRPTPLGKTLDTDRLIIALANLIPSAAPDAVRIHIPRSLRVVYDVRNKRDAAHLADGIDPNTQDATLVVSVLDWVLAEFIRLVHNISPNEATQIVVSIVTRKAPMVQEFDGFLKVLNPTLGASDFVLVLLYHRGKAGATFNELKLWVRRRMQANLKRTLGYLVESKDFVHFNGTGYIITRLGEQSVEQRKLLERPEA